MRPTSAVQPAAACLLSWFIVFTLVATSAALSLNDDDIEDGLAAAEVELQADEGSYRARPATILRRMLNYRRMLNSNNNGGIGVRSLPNDEYPVVRLRPRPIRKRNCRFNLGGHCDTENAAALVARWHNLNSAWSPGRRRRKRMSENRDAGNQKNDRSTSTSSDTLPFNVLYRQLINGSSKLTSLKAGAAPVMQISGQSSTSPVNSESNVVPRRCFRLANGGEQQQQPTNVACIDESDGAILNRE